MAPDPVNPEFSELERRVDRGLKPLPVPAAPPALLRNVMRAVERIDSGATLAAPRALVAEWPSALKIGMTAVGATIVVAALLMWPFALEYARTVWYSPSVVLLRAAVSTIRPMVPAGLMYVTAMCALCAAAASMLKHVALGGATHQ